MSVLLTTVLTEKSDPVETSAWDVATALGTVGAALFTAVAIGVALWLGRSDRKAAEEALQEQLLANREAASRDHEVGLLLRLAECLATMTASGSSSEKHEARRLGRVVLMALPSPGTLAVTRLVFGIEEPNGSIPEWKDALDPNIKVPEDRARREIAERIAAAVKA
jgi:hypothetical protein